MNIKAIVFDINGALIDIHTDEGNEEVYRGISHFLTNQGVKAHRWEVRDEYYQLMDEQRKAGNEAFPEIDVEELWRESLRRRPEACRDDAYYYRKHLDGRFGKKPLESITGFDLERHKGELKKSVTDRGRPYAAQTIKHILAIVRRLFNLARKWGLYDGENPASKVQMPHVDNQVTEFLTDEELSRLLAVLDHWPFDDSAAFVKFCLLTGFRRGELFKMQWEHIDFERRMVTLPDPKGKKTVTIPVSQPALDVLEGLHRSSDFVFPGKDGKQRVDFAGPWQRIRKAAELPDGFRFHGLRHNFASQLISNGVDLAVVGKLLSHKQAQTTARYAHLRPDAVQAAAVKSGELLQPKQKATVIRMTSRE